MNDFLSHALTGGVLIGTAVSMMLYVNRSFLKVSGLINGVIAPMKSDILWRAAFLIGLVLGGFLLKAFQPQVFVSELKIVNWFTVVSGFLVGIGSMFAKGCITGHGISGVGRLYGRSVAATLIFVISGVGTLILLRKLGIAV